MGGGVAVVYQNNTVFTGKPVWQQSGLECLYLVLGDCDREGLLLVYWVPCCPTPSMLWLADLVLDVRLEYLRLLVLGNFNIYTEVLGDRPAQDCLAP